MTRIIIYSSLSIRSGYYGWIEKEARRSVHSGAIVCSIPIFRFTLGNGEECNKIYEEIISIRVEDPPLNMLFINQDSFRYSFSRVLSAVSQE
jgi:hypothetical protein